MDQPKFSIPLAALALGAALLALSAQAQTVPKTSSDLNLPPETLRQQKAELAKGDPQRWFAQDTTAAARLKTIHKEIAAGLQESLGACKGLPVGERPACNREAKAIYQQEMAGAKARAMSEQP
ncbi:MAG: hypothetical protein V4633_10945 [Pseudomonadota bacterium]